MDVRVFLGNLRHDQLQEEGLGKATVLGARVKLGALDMGRVGGRSEWLVLLGVLFEGIKS